MMVAYLGEVHKNGTYCSLKLDIWEVKMDTYQNIEGLLHELLNEFVESEPFTGLYWAGS
jgi:hypothetical protein